MRIANPLTLAPPKSRAVAVACTLAAFVSSPAWAAPTFTRVDEASVPSKGQRLNAPERYDVVRFDLRELDRQLLHAPLARSSDATAAPIIDLPMPDGTVAQFRVYESPVMAPELQARYPELRTYEGYGIGSAADFTRFSITPQGFHGLVFTPQGSVWIDPYQTGDLETCAVFHKADNRRPDGTLPTALSCELHAEPEALAEAEAAALSGSHTRGTTSTGPTLHTYRTVVAATGEYTTFHGGTVPAGMAAIVVAMNRVNGVYQRDFAVFMELVANNDLVVYTNGATDPYTNNDGGAMLGQNQANINAVIGSANYDIGHVFSTGGGGIASLGAVCVAARKAQGVTGLGSPTGDNFYIDYVAHEIGHQFGATHSFNGSAGSCGGGNRTASTAYEPGSGSTIMAYAGICGTHNIQNHSDDYFHNISFEQIRAFTETGSGSNCDATTATGNDAPIVDANIGGSFTIPRSTPFEIEGSATDPNGDDLTYCWEQFDLGPAGDWRNPSGNAPTFRSWDPVVEPSRIFPRLSNLVNNTTPAGEVLPTYDRNLVFRLTVRDGLGGTNWATAQTIAVEADAGPFVVTSPNTTGIEWVGGTTETVTWDVANTNLAPVNCANVDILLSTDGGFTYPTVLLAGTPNDGSANVTVPAVETTLARVRVQASANLFFDISNFNFEISGDAAGIEDVLGAAGGGLFAEPNPFTGVTHVFFELETAAPVQVQVFTPTGRLLTTLAEDVLPAGRHALAWDGTDANGRKMPAGVYFYRFQSGRTVETKQLVLVKN